MYRIGFRENMTIEESLKMAEDCINSNGIKSMDPHFKPQYRTVLKDKENFRVKFIGRLENFKDDWSKIQNKSSTFLEIKTGILNKSPSKKSVVNDATLREKVYEVYKKDYEVLGYEK